MNTIIIASPHRLDLDKIAASGQCFRWASGPVAGSYLVPTSGRCAVIYRLDDLIYIRDYTVSGGSHPAAPDWRGSSHFWESYLGLPCINHWWEELEVHARREPESYITRAAASAYGMTLLRQDPFETLISFIISQNNNIPRIKASVEALCRRHGRRHYIPTARGNFPGAEWWDFPEPEALTDKDKLQGLGLGYRDEYVAAAARAVASGSLNLPTLSLGPYDQTRARLKALPGVGDKVADCVCLYGLGMARAFPVDVHIHRVLEREFPEGFPSHRFPGYAGFVQQLLFYHERHRGKEAGK